METDAALPVYLFIASVLALAAVLLVVAAVFNPTRPGPVKRMPYESGMDPVHDTRRRFDIRFHLVAIAFLVFDVELLFLYPWAVAMRPAAGEATPVGQVSNLPGHQLAAVTPATRPAAKPTGRVPLDVEPGENIDQAWRSQHGQTTSRDLVFAGAMVFIALLALGFVYDWRKGVFQWR
jgi:NADH-quinone oxidoreductase subunit A